MENTTTNRRRTLTKADFPQTAEQGTEVCPLHKLINALPPRQREVTELLASGKDNQQIADELRISKRTVQKHLQLVFRSLKVQHRTELTAKWHQAHST